MYTCSALHGFKLMRYINSRYLYLLAYSWRLPLEQDTCSNKHIVCPTPSWIWSNRKWRRSICRPRKPHPRTKRETSNGHNSATRRCWVMAIWSFSHSGRRTDTGYRITDNGHGMWFYIMSNAAMQCIGQTKIHDTGLVTNTVHYGQQ